MKLTINSTELEQAVATYVEAMGFSLEDKEVTYTLDDEANCHIEIGNSNNSNTTEKVVHKRKPRTKIEPKQKGKTEPEEQEENVTSDGVEELVWTEDSAQEEEEQDTDIPFNEEENEEEATSEAPTSKAKDNAFSLFN